MTQYSDLIKDYNGENPFSHSQARHYSDNKIVNEFYPISLYWSFFNEQNEILIGTRGSGKTIILKMLTYTCLRNLNSDRSNKIVREKKFIGFYFALYNEMIKGKIPSELSQHERYQYFSFIFNCLSLESFFKEIATLLIDIYPNKEERILKEVELVKTIKKILFPKKEIYTIEEVINEIEIIYRITQTQSVKSFLDIETSLKSDIFVPIESIIRYVNILFGLDHQETFWIACIDEAESIDEEYIKIINTFMRGPKKPLVIKMATLPFKHTTLETLHKGLNIQSKGNDFNYRIIDLDCDSDDFYNLTNHLCYKRLFQTGILVPDDLTLESFLGKIGDDDLIDYFKLETKMSNEEIRNKIIENLSSKRQENIEIKSDINHSIFKKFSPVFFTKYIYQLSREGNRTPGWFAGAKTTRKISSGNPRIFIQIMHSFVDRAKSHILSTKEQHRVLISFAKSFTDGAQSLPEFGHLLFSILKQIGENLKERVHDKGFRDVGVRFKLDDKLIMENVVIESLKLGIQYSYLIIDKNSLMNNVIDSNSEMLLSFTYSIPYWLPMRKGEITNIKGVITGSLNDGYNFDSITYKSKASSSIILNLFEGDTE